MEPSTFFHTYFDTIHTRLRTTASTDLQQAAEMIMIAHKAGKKIIIAGNGGSAAMASHVTVDLVKAAGIRALNFNEADLLTCLANDYGYAHWVSRALDFYADKGDLAILISSSGRSENMVNGARQAAKMGLPILTLTGFLSDNPLRQLGDMNLWVDSAEYNIVEMTHHIWLVAMVDYLIAAKK
jgi:D-sedoheptulose 7-phosphate isomerase